MIEVASLFVYPVKGLGGVARDRLEVDRHGPRYDREWMLVGDDGVFVTQREDAGLALIATSLDEDAGVLRLTSAGSPPLEVPLGRSAREQMEARCWHDTQTVLDEGSAAAEWLSERVGRSLRLVRTAPDHARVVPAQFAARRATTRFTDAFPLLVIGEASLERLARERGEAVSMRRFRPNVVVRGCAPHAEDRWSRIQVGGAGGVVLAFGKLCARCQVTTIGPDTGEVAARGEPLRTLAVYRTFEAQHPDGNSERGVFFGANYVHEGEGAISLGDPVSVLA